MTNFQAFVVGDSLHGAAAAAAACTVSSAHALVARAAIIDSLSTQTSSYCGWPTNKPAVNISAHAYKPIA